MLRRPTSLSKPNSRSGDDEMEEMQRVALHDLPVMQQAAQLLGGRRQRCVTGDKIHRLGRRQMMQTGQMPQSRCTTTGASQ